MPRTTPRHLRTDRASADVGCVERGAALCLALLASGALLGCGHAVATMPASSPSRLLGAPGPAFSRATVDGPRFDTASATGRVLLVDFFSSTCAPCRRSLPALQALHRRRAGEPLVIVGVSLDEDERAARALVARYGLTFPVVHDPGNVLAGRFRVTDIPATFLIDRSGRVAWAGGGEQPEGALERAAVALIEGAGESKVTK